jgi:hypothetical protein
MHTHTHLQVTRQLLTTLPGANSELSPLMVNVARILLSKLQVGGKFVLYMSCVYVL